jgi:hypothetical protein
MKKGIILAVIISLFIGCNSSPDLTSQLKTNFASHLSKVDSAVILDSFRLIRVDTIVEKLGKIIDDTIYKREYSRVQEQFDSASKHQNKDSIAFLQYELNYMSGQIDSLTHTIKTADTIHKFGFLISCFYQIRKNDKNKADTIYYFFDKQSNILNPDMIDSFIRRADKFIR